MAITVPTPEDQGAQRLGGVEGVAANTPYQNLQLPDLSFNAKTMQRLGDVLGGFSRQMMDFNNKEALLEAQKDHNDFLNGVYNPIDGVLTQSGANAVGITERVAMSADQFSEEMRKKYGDRLTGSGMLALDTMLENSGQSMVQKAVGYETTQRLQYQQSLAQSNIDNAISRIGLDPTNQVEFERNLSTILSTGASAAATAGATGGGLDAARERELVTAAVGARVAALASTGDNQAAIGVLETYRERVSPETYGKLVEPLRKARDQDIALGAADVARIIDQTGLPPAFVPMVTSSAVSGNASGAAAVQFGDKTVLARDGVVLKSTLANQSFLDQNAETNLRAMLDGPFQALQRAMGMTIVINDALPTEGTGRANPNSPDYNPNSQHWNGAALDIDISNMTHADRLRLVQTARGLGFNGFGFGDGYMHIDMRPQPATWAYGVPKNADGSANTTSPVNGWNGLNLTSLRGVVLGAQAGSVASTTAPKTGAEYINSIADPRVRAEAQRSYMAQVSFDNAVAAQNKADTITSVTTQVETDIANNQLKSLSDYLPSGTISALGDAADDVRKYIQSEIAGEARTTNQDVYNDLYRQMTDANPANAAARAAVLKDPAFILSHQSELSVADFRALQTLQAVSSAKLYEDETKLKTEAAQAVYSAMGNADRSTIRGIVGDQITATTGLSSTKDAQAVEQLQSLAYDAIGSMVAAKLSVMPPAQALTYSGSEGKANMERLISDTAREYLGTSGGFTGRNSGPVELSDDLTMLQVLSVVDDAGITVDDLRSGATTFVISSTGVGDIPVSKEAMSEIADRLGSLATATQVVEAAFELSKGYLVGGEALGLMEAKSMLQRDIEAARAATAAAAAPRPDEVTGIVGAEPTAAEQAAAYGPNPVWKTTPYTRDAAISDMTSIKASVEADGATVQPVAPPSAYNMLLLLQDERDKGDVTQGVNIGYGVAEALIHAVPHWDTTFPADEYGDMVKDLSGENGGQIQSISILKVMQALSAFQSE